MADVTDGLARSLQTMGWAEVCARRLARHGLSVPLDGGVADVVAAPQARMTPEQTDEVVEAIADALADTELTVDELSEAVVDAVGAWAGDLVMPAFQGMWPRWRQAIATAANRGALLFGPNRGRRTTFASPRRWLPDVAPAPGGPAAAEPARRYLHAYGPRPHTSSHSGWAPHTGGPQRCTAQLRELDHQVERIEHITETTPALAIGTVTTGAHA